MTIEHALAGVAVGDLMAAQRWYERVVGRPADVVQAAQNESAEWRFAHGGALQLFVDKTRAGQTSVTFAVPELEPQLDVVRAAGIRVGKTTDTPFVRTAILSDPDGNRVVIAQALDVELAI